MAGKTVSFNSNCNLCDSHIETVAKWLSCNGEVWGVGPTAVFASAAALFLFNELEASIFVVGDHLHVSLLEKTLVSTMVLGMLALMIHLWVCSMRFFQYYLDTLIKDSPNMLLEMTTAGLLGGQEMVALGPLTRFLRQQQPQIHITICWFLSLCYADYVRKHYCQRFNMPYLEQWQAELHERAARQVRRTMERVHSFVGCVHQRLRGFTPDNANNEFDTVGAFLKKHRARVSRRRTRVTEEEEAPAFRKAILRSALNYKANYACAYSANPARPRSMLLRNSEIISRRLDAHVAVHRTPASLVLPLPPQKNQSLEEFPWRAMERRPFDYDLDFDTVIEWAKCGEGYASLTPTVLWGIGAAAITHRMLTALFRRFLFRRVPFWELALQNLLFLWTLIYSLHFWVMLVKFIKIFVDYCYEDSSVFNEQGNVSAEGMERRRLLQQWVIWMCGVLPIAVYIHTRPRPDPPRLMIWITTSPWLRREMGPYGYYLNRPLSTLQSSTTLPRQAQTLRKSFSDSNILIKEPPKRKRHSKSV